MVPASMLLSVLGVACCLWGAFSAVTDRPHRACVLFSFAYALECWSGFFA